MKTELHFLTVTFLCDDHHHGKCQQVSNYQAAGPDQRVISTSPYIIDSHITVWVSLRFSE